MITKILLTAAIVAVAYLLVKARSRGSPQTRHALPSPTSGRNRQLVAYGVLVIFLLGSASLLIWEWRDQSRVVSIRVIDTQTGRSVSYLARKGDIHGRSFETLDGRLVSVAEVERLEFDPGN